MLDIFSKKKKKNYVFREYYDNILSVLLYVRQKLGI